MKKIIVLIYTILISFIIINESNADCMYQEIEPMCGINGETFTNSCQGWSDTSSWSMPNAYAGMCVKGSELDEEIKNRIFDKVDNFFQNEGYYGNIYGEGEYNNTNGNTLNIKGQDFVNNKLFINIKDLLEKEVTKNNPDLLKISILYYVSSIIGYDYYVSNN